MLDVIDIHIHLDKHYPPDPTGVSDYVALGLVGAYAAGTLVGNVALARASAAWKPVCGVNVPLVYAMTFFSLCHLACVCLDVGLSPLITDAVQRISCVGTSFWGEYLLGLGGFLSVLGVRAYALMMVAYSAVLRPDGPKYRRTLAKGIFFGVFLLPVYSLCLLVSVDAESTYDPETGGCDTPIEYKVALVAVLAAYLVVLSLQGVLLATSDVVADRARALLAIIRVAVPLLAIACVIHFAFMLPHRWGRFAFMCVVLTLYTHAYCTLVVPALWEYRTHGRRAGMPVLELDAFDETPALGVLASESPLMRGGASARRMTADIRWLLENMNARKPQLTPQMLIRVEELRARFFNFAKIEYAGYFFTYGASGVLEYVDPFAPPETFHIPTYRLITFYNEVQRIHTAVHQVYSTDKFLNADAVATTIKPMIAGLFKGFLSSNSMTPINLPARYATRLQKGFSRQTVAEWDTPVLTEIMTEILTTLLASDDEEYYSHQFLTDIEEVLESYGHTLYALDEEHLVVYSDAEPGGSAVGNLTQLLEVLRQGRAATRDPDAPDLDATDSDPADDPYEVSDFASEEELGVSLQAAPRGVGGDETLPDGAVIYASPLRALGFFFYDAARAVPTALSACRAHGHRATAPPSDSGVDMQDGDILVHRTAPSNAS